MGRKHQNGGVLGTQRIYYDKAATGVHDMQTVYDAFSGAPYNREGFNKGIGTPGPNAMFVNDQIIFGSCLMQGACGPTAQMINTWIGTMPASLQTFLSVAEPGKGIQRWTVPGDGTYRYKLAGGFASHDGYRYSTTLTGAGAIYNSNLTEVDRGGGGLQSYSVPTLVTSGARGTPGVLTFDYTHSSGDVVDIMVGQRGGSAVYNGASFHVAGSGGGATAVFIDGWSTWNKTTAGFKGGIAGAGGSNRNNTSQGTGVITAYSTSGGAGNGGSGGTNGSGGGDNSSGNYDSASGAGLTGNGSQHTDQRLTPVNVNGRTAKAFSNPTRPGQGNFSGSGYVNPWSTQSSGESLYIYINASGDVTQVGTGNPGYSSAGLTKIQQYAENSTNTLASLYLPINCAQGGFGGGGVGSWGGSGGAGGYSGGGAGDNSGSGGGGSSYSNGVTYVSHAVAQKNTTYNSWQSSDNLIWQGTNYGRTPKGAIIGNGEVMITRIL